MKKMQKGRHVRMMMITRVALTEVGKLPLHQRKNKRKRERERRLKRKREDKR